MAEAIMERVLSQSLGTDWMFKAEAARILKEWWWSGNRYELDEFFEVNSLGPIESADLRSRWVTKLSTLDGQSSEYVPSNSDDGSGKL
jgi:hypothetical protein